MEASQKQRTEVCTQGIARTPTVPKACARAPELRETMYMNTGYTSLTQCNLDSTLDMRSMADKICKLAENLSEPDRTLVRMYLDHENSFRQMAQLLGVSEATVARRVKKIIRRIGDRDIEAILAKSSKLSHRQKKIARDYFLRGLNVKKIAHKYKMTYYNTRRIINLLRNLSRKHKYNITIRYY